MQEIKNDEAKEADFTNENKNTESEAAAPKKQPEKKKTTSKTKKNLKTPSDKEMPTHESPVLDDNPTVVVSEPIADAPKEDKSDDAADVKDIAEEPTEENGSAEKSVDFIEDKHFILPDQVTFFVTDPAADPDTLFPAEDNVTESKNSLLNVEHFSDYKRKPTEEHEAEKDYSEDGQQVQDVVYESITILDSEDSADAPVLEPKQKYEDSDRERYNPEKPRKVDGRFDFLELFVFTLLAVILMTTFVFRHSVVEGSSMQKTLEEGDHLIISDLFYTPQKGDIIVCQDRATGHDNPVVKRVIATEGDTIEILPDGKVFVNDKILDESSYVYTDLPDTYPGLPKTLVPEGMVFVMGDHRNKSSDSRYFDSVFVREDAILGKVILRFYPFKDFGTVR